MNCKVENHQKYKAVTICLEANCKAQHRLACPKCICEIHYQHTKKCIFIEDIMKQENKILNWSNNEISKQVTDIVNQLQDEDQNQDESIKMGKQFFKDIEQFEYTLTESVESQRFVLKNKYQKFKEQMDKIMKQLMMKFLMIFDLKPIFALLRSYLKRQITRQELCTQVKGLISNEQRKVTMKELDQLFRKKNKLCAEYNKSQFKELAGQAISDVQMLPYIIQSGAFSFLVPKIGAFNNLLKVIEPGRVFGFNNLDSQQYIYGNKVFKGQKEFFWSLKFEDIPTSSYNSIYIGVVQESKKEDVNNLFQVGSSAYLDIVNQAQSNCMISRKKTLAETIRKRITNKETFIIKLKLDLIQKGFFITDDKEEIEFEYSMKTVKAQTQHNVYNQHQHQQFFSNAVKLRPFILSYSSTAKITLLDS